MTPVDRILSRCVEDGDCLVWQGALTRAGHPRHRGSTSARRVVWESKRGPIPDGKVVTVTCGCDACLNQKHMTLTTRVEVLRSTMKRPDVFIRKTVAVTKKRRAAGKLDMDKARYIRASEKTLQEVADELGISATMACRVRRNEAWRELVADPFSGLGARA